MKNNVEKFFDDVKIGDLLYYRSFLYGQKVKETACVLEKIGYTNYCDASFLVFIVEKCEISEWNVAERHLFYIKKISLK